MGCLFRFGQAAGEGHSCPGRPCSLRPWKASPGCAASPEWGHVGAARGSWGQAPCLLGTRQPRPGACVVLKARDERPAAAGGREERQGTKRAVEAGLEGSRPGLFIRNIRPHASGAVALWSRVCGGFSLLGPGWRAFPPFSGRQEATGAWPATCPAWLQ